MIWIKRLLALIFVVLFSLVFVIVFTFSVIVSKGHNDMKTERWKLDNQHRIGFIPDEAMMYRARPSNTYLWSEFTNNPADSVIVISTDSFSRRITKWSPERKKHALFMGCSYIYGDGLSDEFTIPYVFSDIDTTYNPYNYALSGYGTAHVLEILMKGIKDEIPEEEGVGIYFMIDHHKDRITNDPYTMLWGYDFPRYGVDDNLNLLREGTFAERDRIGSKFWKGFGEFSLWKHYITVLQFRQNRKKAADESSSTSILEKDWTYQFANDVPVATTIHDHKYLLMSKIIKSAEEMYLKQFPKGKFYVVIFPGEKTEVLRYLEYDNLNVINLSQALDIDGIGGHQADGYHPNEIGAEAIAKMMSEVLADIQPEIY